MTTLPSYDFCRLKPAMHHQNVNLYEFQPIMTLIAPNSLFTNRTINEFKARIHAHFRDLPNGGFQKPVGLNSPDGRQVILYPEPMLQRLAEIICTELAEDLPMV